MPFCYLYRLSYYYAIFDLPSTQIVWIDASTIWLWWLIITHNLTTNFDPPRIVATNVNWRKKFNLPRFLRPGDAVRIQTGSLGCDTKCKNQHLLEVAGALLLEMNVSQSYGLTVVLIATFFINSMQSRVLGGKFQYKSYVWRRQCF